jgi:hypothetical protein
VGEVIQGAERVEIPKIKHQCSYSRMLVVKGARASQSSPEDLHKIVYGETTGKEGSSELHSKEEYRAYIGRIECVIQKRGWVRDPKFGKLTCKR